MEKLRLNSQERQRRRKARFTIIQIIQELQLQEMQYKKILEKSIEVHALNKDEIENGLNETKERLNILKQMVSGPQN